MSDSQWCSALKPYSDHNVVKILTWFNWDYFSIVSQAINAEKPHKK